MGSSSRRTEISPRDTRPPTKLKKSLLDVDTEGRLLTDEGIAPMVLLDLTGPNKSESFGISICVIGSNEQPLLNEEHWEVADLQQRFKVTACQGRPDVR